MRTTIVKGCLYCGLRLPNSAHFCPECGRPVEVVIRFDSDVKQKSATMTKGCVYCGLQLPDSVDFCPECGRPIERGSLPHTDQESETDCHKEIEEKDELVRKQEASFHSSDPIGHKTARLHDGHVHLILLLY